MRRNLLLLALIISVSCFGSKTEKRAQVLLETSKGNIRIELYNETPLHRDNFLKKVKKGLYDGLLFHRVIKDFMIQGGDQTSKNAPKGKMLGDGLPGEDVIPAEFVYPQIFHKRGVIAMARESDDVNPKRNSSSWQFYIVWGKKFDDDGLLKVQKKVEDRTGKKVTIDPACAEYYKAVGGTPHLDGMYTAFGEVVEGLDVVDKIQQVATDENDRPLEDVKIIKAKVLKSVKHKCDGKCK
jgi:peptidyl-prolyl cis-trans isomerase B (cyclophilin B)